MKTSKNKKPLIRALEPRILFDGAAVTTAVEVLDNTSFTETSTSTTDTSTTTTTDSTQINNTANSTDSTQINDATTIVPDSLSEPISIQTGDIFIITTDIPNYELTANNLASNFKVLVLDQNSADLESQILDATKDLDSELNVHIMTANQSRDKLLVGSFESVNDLTLELTSDSKLYDLDSLTAQDYTPSGEGQVIIIDESVSYAQNILDTIPNDWKVITINSQEDGLSQILEKLEGSSNISTIHIFSHGNSGEIILGNLVLDSNTIEQRAADLAKLGTYLNLNGDILLYGCDVSSGYIGEEFVNLLAQKTSADIAASDDATGSYIASADFYLETTSGNIESSTLEVDTNGTILGSFTYYDINLFRNSQRLILQASGEGGSGIWNSAGNNWVDVYNTDRIVPYLASRTVTKEFLFWSWTYDEYYIENYNYGTGVRYTENKFTIAKNSTYDIRATISDQLKNYLGGEKTASSTENFALYKGSFDKYNPLKNLVTASEGWLGEYIYRGELEAGDYVLVTSFDTFALAFFKVDVNYAEQMYGTGKLTVENLNKAPVWGTIADQTISGDGIKNIVATTWSNVSDADGDEITVSATLSTGYPLPTWLKFNPNTLTFSGNPPENTGTLSIRLNAFDGQETGYKDFKLIFTNDNDRPILANEIKDTTWDGQGVFTYQIPVGTFTDSDPSDDNFTYTAKLADGSALPSWLTISNTGLISGNPPAGYPSLTIVVTANDGSGQSNATQTDTFVLNLKNNNDIPSLTNTAISIDEDTTYTFKAADFAYTDSDTHAFDGTLIGNGKTIQSIRVLELPQNGTLWLDTNSNGVLNDGEKVLLNQVILATNFSKLKYTPNENWAGHNALDPLPALKNGPDSFKWTSSDGYNDSSNTATTTLNVKILNDDPKLSFSAGKTLNVRPTGGAALNPVYVDQGLNLIDVDALYSNDMLYDTIYGVSITITDSVTNKFVIGDKLSIVDATGFTISYDSVNGILTIEKAGGARASEYQAILRTLQFSSTDTSNNNLRTLGLTFRTQGVGSKTAAYFDGADDYIETMNASIPTTGNFTISTWAQLSTPANLATGQYTIFGQGESANNNNIFLQVVKNSDNTYNLRIGNLWNISGTEISSLLSDGKWHQYTITRSGTGTSDGSLYIDGKYIGSGDINTNITAGYGLRIGRLYDSVINNGSDWPGYWKGSISDLRVYNTVLSSTDIQKSLSNTLVGNETGLKAWYKLVSDYKNYASVSDGGNAVVFKQANYGYSIKTGHYYKLDTTERNYADANLNAQNSTYASENGYLVRIDDSLSASELEVVKLMNSLYGSTVTLVGAERYNSNGDWYWTAGPDSDTYFTHTGNDGLDNDPVTPKTYNEWWSGEFGQGNWKSYNWNVSNLKTEMTFDLYAWDSWDNEVLAININDTRLYNIQSNHQSSWNNNSTYNGSMNINGYNISFSIVPSEYRNIGQGSEWSDKIFKVTVNIPENFTSNLKLSIGALTDSDLNDESGEVNNISIKTFNPEYEKDKAFINLNGYIDNLYPNQQYWSLVEYGNKGEVLTAPSLFTTTNVSSLDKYVNETRSITVRATNNAPSATESWSTTAINEDSSYTFKVTDFTSKFSDSDGDTLSKITITQIPDSSIGTLTLNGKTLENNAEIPTGDLDKLIFKPTANYSGDVTFKYKGSDGYLDTNESTVTIKVNPLNDAPVLTADQTLQAINEDITSIYNIGQTIASIITDGTITDVDGNSIEAIAITSVNNSYGTWQYYTNGGTSWTPISNTTGAKVSLSSKALLLDSNSLVRFIPNENFFGTSTFEFRAWDKSSGIVGGTTDPYLLGGNSSVSAEVKIASIIINPINDIPTTENKTIEINEDEDYIFTLSDFKFSDIDTNDVLKTVKIESLPSIGILKLNGKILSEATIISKSDIEDGKLIYLTSLDGFGKPYTTFTFSVNDGTANSIPATITLNATDTNDAPKNIEWASGGSVAEDKYSTSSTSVVVGKLSATDPNTNDTLRFVQLSNNKFVINPDGTVKLAISPKDLNGNNVALLDYELNQTEKIKVKVIDSQGLSYETEITVNVTDIAEKTPSLYTNVLYATKGTVKTLTESNIRTVDADTANENLIYTVKQEIVGGKLFIDKNGDGTYNEGIDSLLGPESEEAPEYEANFTHADVVAGKIKFYKDDTQTNAKISLSVTDGTSSDEGLVIVIVSNPPVLSAQIEDQEWGVSGSQSFTIPASTFTDADYDVLTYSAKLSDGKDLPTWLSFDSKTGKFSGTPDGMKNADTISITVTATDGRTKPATNTFIITFKDSIKKPILANPLPEYIEFNGSGNKEYSIPADTFSNPLANTTLTYTATLGNGNALPSWLSFDPTTQKFSGNPPASAVGEPLIIKITASNGTTTSTTTSTTIKLYVSNSNDIPVKSGTIDDKTISDANTHTYTIDKSKFSDGDNDAITLMLTTQDGSELPSWVKYSTDSNGDLIITAKAPAGSGIQDLRVIGRDGFGGESISNFKITYSGGANESPQVRTSEGIFYMENGSLKTSSYGALEKFSILEGKTATITTTYLDENDADDDGIGLTYTLVNEPLYGQLWLDIDGSGTINGSEKTLNSGDTFTQKDIDDKKLKYKHTAPNTTDDKFVFNLKDGGENVSAEVKGVTFNIDVLEDPTLFSLISVTRYNPIGTLTNADEVQFKVKFSGLAYGVDASDFVLTGLGATSNTNATISSVTNLGSNEYMVKVTGITSNNGTLGLALATNPNIITTGGSPIDETFVTPISETFTLDNTAPTVTITTDRTIYAGTTPFNGTLVFSEKVTNLTLEDIKAVNATISNLTQIDDKNFSFVITPNGDKESIILNFANAMVNDIAGNENSSATEVIITRNGSSTISNTKIIESNKIDGSTNNLIPLFPNFDNTDLSNIEKSQGLKSLNITIPSNLIKDGANENLTIGDKIIPLNFKNNDVIENVTIGVVEYKIKAIIVDGNSTLVFEKNDGSTITLNEAKALIDSIKYNNSSTPPTIGDRIFSLSIENSTERKFTEIDGIDTTANDVYLFSEVSLGDTDLSQGLQSLKISVPTASILDGAKEELIVNATVIPLNFTNGKAVANITLNGVEYKIAATVIGGISTLVFEKASGEMSFDETEALLDVIKYNNSSDEPTISTNRQFSLVVNDGLEDSSASIVTVKIVSTNDKPVISVETGNSENASLTESNTTLKTSGTLSVTDLDLSQTVNVSTVSVVATQKDSTNANMTSSSSQPSNETLLAMLGLDSGNVINSTSATRTINWVFNSGTETFDYLAVRETLILAYTIKATDNASLDSANQTILITITGTNDAPKITASTITALSNASSPVTAGGNLLFSDIDTTTPTASFVKANDVSYVATRSGGGSFSLNADTISALQNALTLNSNGTWSYSLNTTLLEDSSSILIASGDKIVVTYKVTVDDGKGGTTTKDLKFILIGDGTGAKLSINDDTGSIIEGSKLTDSGRLNFNGTPIKTNISINDSTSLTPTQIDTIKSGLKITPTTDGNATNWEYSLTEDKIDFLAEGQTVTAKFDVGDSALLFSGDDKVSIPSPTLTNSFTVELWIKLDAPTSNWQAVLDKGRYTAPRDWYIITNDKNYELIMGYDYFTNADPDHNQIFLNLNDLNWHHVAFSYDKTNFTWTAYLDGVLKGTFTKEYTPTSNSILLGNNNYNGGSKVELNELRIWNDVRTKNEIIANMNSVISNPTGESNLLSYYKFDETSGTTIFDSKGNKNGTISETSSPTWIGSSPLTITITGTNDAPVITSTVESARGTVTEAGYSAIGTPSATGTLTSTDVDSGASKTWSLDSSSVVTSLNGTYGNISIDNTGKWTYTLDESKVSILEVGDKKTEIFTATITDDKGATAQQTILIEVNGTNDAPVIKAPTTILYENTFNSQTGKLIVVDDGNDTKTYSIDRQNIDTTENGFTHSKKGVYGTLYINEITGDYKFVPNESAIKALTENSSEIFKFTVTDSLGATSKQDLTLSFKGVNDTPTITVGTNDSDSKEIYETNTTLTSSGTLTVTDVDIAQLVSSEIVQSMTIDGVTSTDVKALGWLTLNTTEILNNTETTDTLTWTFNSGDEYFNSLSQGETKTLVYTIRVSDGTLYKDKTVTITIKGTNDAPTITVVSGDSATATLTESNETLSANDTLTVNEIEPNDTITATVESVNVNSSSTVSNLVLPSNTILKAMLSLSPLSKLGDSSNTTDTVDPLTWTFNSGSEHFDYIASGEKLVLDYVVRVIDSANPAKIDTKTITITINGSNDTPIIDTYASNDVNINGIINSGKPFELADKGTIAFSDVDFSNKPTATETIKSITAYKRDKITTFALTPTQISNITNGFKISSGVDNTNNGILNWEYAISQSNIDFLGSAEQVVAIFTISVNDGNGGKASQDITIELTGENKTPILTEATKNIDETNDAINTTIEMTASDANLTDILTVSVESGTYQLNGEAPRTMSDAEKSWLSLQNYTVSNGTPFNWDFKTDSTTFNELNTGETVKLVYTVKIIDDAPIQVRAFSTKTVTVTITGTNDAPVAVVDVAETTENSAITIDVLVNDIDVDSADNSSNFTLKEASITTNSHSAGYNASNVPLTQFATVSIVDNKLVFNPNSEFDYLAVGETASVVVTYTMSDNEGLTSTSKATITIKGTNDTPIITLEASDNASEDFVESVNIVTTSGTLSLNDKDTTNIVSVTVDSVTISGTAQVGSKTNDYFKSMLTLSSENILNNTQNDGRITWNFNSGSDIFDYIAKDEVLVLTYKIKATDSSEVSTTQDVVIKITGTNDTPVLNEVLETTFTDTNVDDVFENYTGTLVANDLDISDIKTYSITNQVQDTTQTGFTHSKVGNYGTLYINSTTGAYKYIPNDVKIEELTTNEVDEFTFSVTDDSQEINNIDSKIFRVNLLGVNDTPRVLGNNIDAKTSFGEVFNQETAYLFSDIDRGHILTFTTSKLPQGLSIDKNTGIISGRAVESGNFTITITASDSGNPTLSVSRTFNLLVIAPPQNLSTDTTSTRNTNETAQQIVKEITVDRINDTITAFSSSSNSLIETIGTKNQVEQLLNSMNSNTLGGKNGSTNSNLDISRTELTSIGQTTSNNPNDKIITANANLNLDQTGKVNVNDKANQAFQTLGLTIEKISLAQEQIEVKLLDTRVGQKYSVTLANGNELPEGLSFDPNTGKIVGVLPDGVTELNISIKALSNDGTTRVLNLKIDLKELKKKQSAFNTLSEQVEKQSFKMSDYGSFINSLVSKAV